MGTDCLKGEDGALLHHPRRGLEVGEDPTDYMSILPDRRNASVPAQVLGLAEARGQRPRAEASPNTTGAVALEWPSTATIT